MNKQFTRREFLMLGAGSLAALAFRPFQLTGDETDTGEIARIAIKSVSVYSKPDDKSEILYQRYRDDLVNLYYMVDSDGSPQYNRIWYRVWGGYIHSAHLQHVKTRYNPVATALTAERQLGEITVPMTQSMRYIGNNKWQPEYRLYYESVHWVTAIDEGPDGDAWYRLHDELLEVDYHIPATHIRMIPSDELLPISPDVDPFKKRIEVSIAHQSVKAYEDDQLVLDTRISSGVPQGRKVNGKTPTDTPTGEFHIQSKMASKHMGDGNLTSDIGAYELPGVPWTCFFEPKTGVAFHGTYWHTNYGLPMSHGCVNMRVAEAKWIFNWSTPVFEPTDIERRGYGTLVIVS
jgi:hypothetical protein